MNEETFWVSVWAIIAVGIVSLAIVAGHYNQKTNEQILRATSCQQIAAIVGDGNRNRFAICALQKKEAE